MPIGCKVTLRRERMYEFLDRFVTIALPRVRDFRGLNDKAFDGRGNYATGLKEQLIFPEISYDQVDKTRGMDVIVADFRQDRRRGARAAPPVRFPVPAAGRREEGRVIYSRSRLGTTEDLSRWRN